MSDQPPKLEMGQPTGSPTPTTPPPTAAPPPPAPQSTSGGCALKGCLLVFVVLVLMLIAFAIGAAGGWYAYEFRQQLEQQLPPDLTDWRQIAPGIGVAPSETPGNYTFTIDADIAAAWGTGQTLEVPVIDVPVNDDELQATSDDLLEAIMDRNDRAAVHSLLCLLATEPSLQRDAEFYMVEAVTQGRTDLVTGMVLADVHTEAVDGSGNGLLHLAARHNHNGIVAALLGNEAFDLDARNSLGQTPLLVSAEAGSVEAAKAMLSYARDQGMAGALLAQKDSAGRTAAALAQEMGHTRYAEMLQAF